MVLAVATAALAAPRAPRSDLLPTDELLTEPQPSSAAPSPRFSSHSGMLWMDDEPLHLKGINWYGFGSQISAFSGMYAVPPHWFLDFLEENHFNAVRVPLDLELLTDPTRVSAFITRGLCKNRSASAWSRLDRVVNASHRHGALASSRPPMTREHLDNATLRDALLQQHALVTSADPCASSLSGKPSLEVLDWFVDAFAARGILVLFDLHCLYPNCNAPKKWQARGPAAEPGLFFDAQHPLDATLDALHALAYNYKDKWNVLGVDVLNEPYRGTWAMNLTTDMDAYAVQAARVIHSKAPGWLIFVQGTMHSPDCRHLIDNLVKDLADGDENNCH
jgi:aryl-phospho-beta-D-glucosidase BglC (GH1 family)